MCEEQNGHENGCEWVLNVLTSRSFGIKATLSKSKSDLLRINVCIINIKVQLQGIKPHLGTHSCHMYSIFFIYIDDFCLVKRVFSLSR